MKYTQVDIVIVGWEHTSGRCLCNSVYVHFTIVDLPGIPKEELDITIGDGMITIKGERKKLFEEDDIWGNRRTERTFGKVSRSFTLPLDCDTDKAEALFEMGTLKVTFPKKAVSAASKKLLIT